MNPKIKELMEKRARAIEAGRAMLDKASAEKRELTAEETPQYEALMKEVDDLQAAIKREERQAALDAELNESANQRERRGQPGNGVDPSTPVNDTPEYRTNLLRYMLGGPAQGLRQDSREERAVLGVALSAGAGVLAPSVLERALLDFGKENNVIRQLADVRMSASDVDIPFTIEKPKAYIVGEGENIPLSTAKFDVKKFKAYKAAAIAAITVEALQDIVIDFEAWIRDEFGETFSDLEEDMFINGNEGIFDNALLNRTNTDGYVIVEGEIASDDLIDLMYGVESRYRKKGVFLASDELVKAVRKLKDANGQYIWQPSYQAGQPDTLLGKPLYTSPFMPGPSTEVGVEKKPVLFGDFSYFRIYDRKGLYIQRLNELYAATGQVGFLAYKRFDGKVINDKAFKHIAHLG